jgi:hypothetical protein
MKILFLIFLSISLWANIGNVMAVKGDAQVKRSSEALVARSGMEIQEGDEVLTKPNSRVQVMLNDDTVVTIGADSSFSFEEFTQDGQDSKVAMRAKRGFFRSVTGKIGKLAPERFKVKTASATIGIRGTDFSGNILENSQEFRCYKGVIYVEFEGVSKDLVAGMALTVSAGKSEIKKFETKETKETKKQDNQDTKTDSKDSSTDIGDDAGAVDDMLVEGLNDITTLVEQDLATTKPVEPFEITPNLEDRPAQY